MAIRTTQSQAIFTAPFDLPEIDGLLPAGIYDVETEEEIIEGNERTVYVRVATLFYVRSLGMTRIVTIDPRGLAFALGQDVLLSGS
jgi:hypothetical protein